MASNKLLFDNESIHPIIVAEEITRTFDSHNESQTFSNLYHPAILEAPLIESKSTSMLMLECLVYFSRLFQRFLKVFNLYSY